MKYVALLRAVNVAGHGKMPMSDLRAMCERVGCRNVQTYIQSGNVMFQSEGDVAARLSAALEAYFGAARQVVVLTAEDMEAVLAHMPFHGADGKQVGVMFYNTPVGALSVTGQRDEVIEMRDRVVYVHYPTGMGRSKLRFGAGQTGTMRNLNTVQKLVEMLRDD
ncbi:MAG: DUF1697 domain-containing protein [Pseudomonadota bacterium]